MKFMKSSLAKILLLALIIFAIISAILKLTTPTKQSPKILSANFVGFDFSRAILGNSEETAMLLKPGAEAHSYEPTPADIIAIKSADLFIYTGGESDTWVDRILEANNIPAEKTFRLMDYIALKEEEAQEGMESEDHDHSEENHNDSKGDEPEYDEHVWTSLKNSIALVEALNLKLSDLYPSRANSFAKNAANYTEKLSSLDQQISNVVKNTTSPELIFGDRFPFRYFVDDYNLNYYAAFPGCSDQVEASPATVAFLIEKAKSTNAKVIFKIELTSGNLAETIARESGAKVLELHSAHNISADDFKNGITFADLMERNLSALKKALN